MDNQNLSAAHTDFGIYCFYTFPFYNNNVDYFLDFRNMNLQLIKRYGEHYPGGLRKLAVDAGMSEGNLHRCVRENKIQAQDLEKIAIELKVSIGYFFDEEVTEMRQAGRDYVEDGKIEHKGTEYNAPVTIDNDLLTENAELKRKLIEAQDKIIKLMEDRK